MKLLVWTITWSCDLIEYRLFNEGLRKKSSEQLLKKTEQPMVMYSMEKLLSYVQLTLIFERFCHLSFFFFFLRELRFADQKFYKNSQIVNFLMILSLCLELKQEIKCLLFLVFPIIQTIIYIFLTDAIDNESRYFLNKQKIRN